MDLVLFPTDKYYSYLKEYIKNKKFQNPIYVGYDFENAEISELNYESYDSELQLKVALEYIQKFCQTNKEKEIRVYLYTPDISYYYDNLDFTQYLCSNIVEFNYMVKECERLWTCDFDKKWLEDKRVHYVKM
jgi:hypothetical protein